MEALADGSFPIYIDYEAILGYGYPTKWFYPDITLIPTALLANATNVIFAYKTMMVVASVLTGVFMYATMSRVYNSSYIASMAALLYTFSYYRIQGLFERAALGETLALTFLPIAFLGIYEIVKGDYKKWYILSIGFTLLIFTHVIVTFLVFLTIVIYLLVYNKTLLKDTKRIYYLVLSGLVTACLTAYFLYPLLEQMISNDFYYNEKPFFHIGGSTFTPLFLWWAVFGVSFYPNTYDSIFLPALGSILTIMVAIRIFIRTKSRELKNVDNVVIIGIFYVILCSSIIPWQIYPFKLLNVIQFTWRLFGLISFLFAIGGAYYSHTLIKSVKHRSLFTAFIIILIIATNVVESKNVKTKYKEYPFEYEATVDNFYCQGTLEYVPAKVESGEYIDARRDRVDSKYKETQVSDFKRNKRVVNLNIKLADNKPEAIEVPLLYYKGYSATINGKETPVGESKNGLVELTHVDESGTIEVAYTGTTIQKVSTILSMVSIILLCAYIFFTKRRIEE
jgi:uncharacterized membrane protein